MKFSVSGNLSENFDWIFPQRHIHAKWNEELSFYIYSSAIYVELLIFQIYYTFSIHQNCSSTTSKSIHLSRRIGTKWNYYYPMKIWKSMRSSFLINRLLYSMIRSTNEKYSRKNINLSPISRGPDGRLRHWAGEYTWSSCKGDLASLFEA